MDFISEAINHLSLSGQLVKSVNEELEEKRKHLRELESIILQRAEIVKDSTEVQAALKLIEMQKKEWEEKVKQLDDRGKQVTFRERKAEDLEKKLVERESNIKESETKLKEREKEVEEREKLLRRTLAVQDSVEKKIQECVEKTSNKISFNLRGTEFTVDKNFILSDHPDSLLAVLVERGNCTGGSVFIDRDPTYFGKVLQVMKGYIPHTEGFTYQSVADEITFYLGSVNQEPLISPFHSILSSWLQNKFFHLIYKGSRDGFEVSKFHTLCDNKGPTLNILQTVAGHIFGGYNPESWVSSSTEFTNPNTFIFTLNNPHLIPPTKYVHKKGELSSSSFFDWGVSFGGQEDGDPNFVVKNASVHVNNLISFIDTTGKGVNTFTGQRGASQLKEILVFIVQ